MIWTSQLGDTEHMSNHPIAAVMIHVADVVAARDWYQRAFPDSVAARSEADAFDYLLIHGVQLELVPADQKVAAGPSGSVVYWRVEHFETVLAHMLSMGARLYRGPMQIEGNLYMCQVQDPWGNCIGLRGP